MTEKKRYKFKKENVNDFDEYGLESPILLKGDVLTFGEVIDLLNEQDKRIQELETELSIYRNIKNVLEEGGGYFNTKTIKINN